MRMRVGVSITVSCGEQNMKVKEGIKGVRKAHAGIWVSLVQMPLKV